MNGILLTSSRLFYAGACENQMPEILTMIQIQRLTPAPAVLAISFVSSLFIYSIEMFFNKNFLYSALNALFVFLGHLCVDQLCWLRDVVVNRSVRIVLAMVSLHGIIIKI